MALTIINSCRKPYLPPIIAASSNYLVVEGVINPQDSTIIKLSRTVQLSSTTGTKPELSATVIVESDANGSYALTETGNGYYSLPDLNLSSSAKYHLKITTSDGKAYQSDFVPVKNSPPIDSVYYLVKSKGLQINADTHDDANSAKYYRWQFNETWIIHTAFYSLNKVVHTPDNAVVRRSLSDQVYTCWTGSSSNDIVLNSSEKLAKDEITNNQIAFIPSSSEKIAHRYSILVKQYALTKEAYQYWQQLKKNTEQLGSIFDAQPSEIPGNIHCITAPSEPVIGYVSAGISSQKRIFVDNAKLPAWQPTLPYSGCYLDTAYFSHPNTGINDVAEFLFPGVEIPVYTIYNTPDPRFQKIIGFSASSPICVDCTLRGTNIQPDFWQ